MLLTGAERERERKLHKLMSIFFLKDTCIQEKKHWKNILIVTSGCELTSKSFLFSYFSETH